MNLQPERRTLAINVVIPTHELSWGILSMADPCANDAQIEPYVRALEAIVYDDLMEKTDREACIDKYEDVADIAMSEEMKSMCKARESVMKVVTKTKEDFLQKNPAFIKRYRKIIRTLMAQAPRTSDGVSVEGSTLVVKGVCSFPTPDAHILHAWWYVRVAPDLLVEMSTPENLDDLPIEEVARNWFAATKAIHNFQSASM